MMPMQPRYRVRRSSNRNFLHAAAEVRSSAIAGAHVAVVRDISESGVFFYSDFKPALGTNLCITIKPSFVGDSDAGFYCEGTVVRVEQQRPEAAPGIALRLTDKLAPSYIAHLENFQPQIRASA
ncbi:MAG: PilZ domain-containing protein [Acidobacteriales bacterium]|nr:PilZ domain-containing protein [Terriglobales bacterium]